MPSGQRCCSAPSFLQRIGLSFTGCFSAFQDAFRAFHLDLDFVGKFLKPLLIGELAPEEPSLDRGKSVSGTWREWDEAGWTGGVRPHCQRCGRRFFQPVQETPSTVGQGGPQCVPWESLVG